MTEPPKAYRRKRRQKTGATSLSLLLQVLTKSPLVKNVSHHVQASKSSQPMTPAAQKGSGANWERLQQEGPKGKENEPVEASARVKTTCLLKESSCGVRQRRATAMRCAGRQRGWRSRTIRAIAPSHSAWLVRAGCRVQRNAQKNRRAGVALGARMHSAAGVAALYAGCSGCRIRKAQLEEALHCPPITRADQERKARHTNKRFESERAERARRAESPRR
jgi:hypothetical protein